MENRLYRARLGSVSIPRALTSDTRVSIEARGLMAYMLSCSEGWCFNSKALCEVCCVGRDKMQAMLGELRTYGYLRVKAIQGPDGRMAGQNWMIDEAPDRVPENPDHGSTECLKIRSHKEDTISKDLQKKEPAHSEPDLFRDPEPKEAEKASEEQESASAFEAFWQAYPTSVRKVNKRGCAALFAQITKGQKAARGKPAAPPVPAEQIVIGAAGYAASEPDPQYIPAPHRWLNEARWERYISAAQAGPAKSDVDLCLGFIAELKGKNPNALPHHLWHKYQHVREVTAKLRAAGLPVPWQAASTLAVASSGAAA